MYSTWVKIAFVCLVAAGGTTAALSKTGNFTVFSDTACQDPLFVNSEIKGRDFCAPTDNEGNWGGEATDFIFKSYILNERPWCDNGSRPYFNVYSDQDCANLIKSYPAGALYNPTGPDADGTCVVPSAEYKAVAFVCDGFDTPPPSSTSELPMTSTPTSTSVRVSTTALTSVTSTPITTETAAESSQTSTIEKPTTSVATSVSDTTLTGIATAFSSSASGKGTSATSSAPTVVVTAGAAWTRPGAAIVMAGLPAAILVL
ncbi:hypothetical protein AB5N19_13984 [Seiridium cardinale]